MKNKEVEFYKGTWYFRTKIDASEFYRVLGNVYQFWHSIHLKWVYPNHSEGWKQRKKAFASKRQVLTKVSKLEILLMCGPSALKDNN